MQQQENESGAHFGSFTRSGVKTIYASPKKSLDVRVLPAFDDSMSLEDSDFDKGFLSYRSRGDEIDEETQTEAFNSWFWCIEGYTYFGFGKKQFLSPLTGVAYFPPGHDPIRDAYVYIDKHVNDARIKTLAHGKTIQDPVSGREKKLAGYLSKTPRRFCLMNVLADPENTGKWENAVLVCSQTTLRDLKEQLSIQTKRSDDVVVTKEWEDYYFGDITDPSAGAVARVQEKHIAIGNNTVRTCGFFLEQAPNTPDAHNIKQLPVTEEQLAGRYRIFDTNTVTNLPPKEEQYQIILDYLVEDGVIPIDVLEAACGKFGKIDTSLRMSNNSWFEGEEPIIGASEVNKSASIAPPTKSTVGKKEETGTAPAVDSLKKQAKESDDLKDAEDPVDEDVPGDNEKTQAKEEPPAEKSEDKSAESGNEEKERERFLELQNKMKESALSPDELTELAGLSKYAG